MIGNGPLVSIVIPMYQAGDWIGETLRSVGHQTLPGLEVVVVDDGSTDDGGDIVRRMAAAMSLDLHLVQTPNAGVAAARNRGIDESRGEFIALLDADDLWHPMKLEHQVERLAASEAPLCTCGYEFLDDRTDRRTAVVAHVDGSNAIDRWLALEGNGLALASTALVRRSALDDLRRFDPAFSVSADLEFALRIAEVGPIDVVPEVLVRYRIHAGQMHRQVSGLAGDLERLHDRVFAGGTDPRFERRCRANLDAHLGYVHLRSRRVRAGMRHLVRAARRDARRLVTVPVRAFARRTGRWLRARTTRPVPGWPG